MPDWKGKNWLEKTGYSLAGIRDALKTEIAVRQEFLAFLLCVALGFWRFGVSRELLKITFIGLSPIIVELINTAFEIITDLACGTQYNEKIRMAKDMLSGATFLTFIVCYGSVLLILFK